MLNILRGLGASFDRCRSLDTFPIGTPQLDSERLFSFCEGTDIYLVRNCLQMTLFGHTAICRNTVHARGNMNLYSVDEAQRINLDNL